MFRFFGNICKKAMENSGEALRCETGDEPGNVLEDEGAGRIHRTDAKGIPGSRIYGNPADVTIKIIVNCR